MSFTCQFGPDDCHVSRVQLCAINELRDNPDAVVEFLACQMDFGADLTGETVSDNYEINCDQVIK